MVREAGLFIAPTLRLERCGRAVYIGLSMRPFIAGGEDTRQPRLCDVNAQVGEGLREGGGIRQMHVVVNGKPLVKMSRQALDADWTDI